MIQQRKDGATVPILASVSVIKDASGKIIGAVAANRDLSELKFAVSSVEVDDQLL